MLRAGENRKGEQAATVRKDNDERTHQCDISAKTWRRQGRRTCGEGAGEEGGREIDNALF